ncbi:MAG: transcription termination/antitermination protein NusA [Oscillospiraceae bacterium]|jgi:N utilization substance protein A|nr:transcription termination/antitermination protein NusA [Oscillospiraceae bacterium]MBQ8929282.1 transcription termination/antitermination protein NusA [Oscillospiraceae bacterium]MBR6430649.1 transcription termination/antitermination protein NusA [Oscillospiraceae bacterium]
MNAEFFDAIAQLESEKGIPQQYMLEKIEQALLAALRKDNPAAAECAVVDVDPEKKKIEMYIQKEVVEDVFDSEVELSLEEAHAMDVNLELGDKVNFPVETKKFGRIAAQAAKQVIIQGIREAERSMVYNEFTSKEHEILTGVIHRIDPTSGNISMKISSNSEYTDALLLRSERIATETLREGDRLKVYVIEVRKTPRGPQVLISRTHPGLVKRLFELEVPEIFDGVVQINSIAREAGSRTKIAVSSENPDVDPIGACVGPKGGRVSAVVEELGGEKIDIAKYSEDPAEFVASALSPSDVISVEMLDEKSCRVIVPDNQLSLAIGKEGQNVRLAAKLTGLKIDIKPESQAE